MVENELLSAIEGVRKANDTKWSKLEEKMDEIRKLVQAVHLEVTREIAELKANSKQNAEFTKAVLSALTRLGELETRVSNLKTTLAILTPLVVGQWAAIVALWRALPNP